MTKSGAQVQFGGKMIEWRPEESLLDCLERHGAGVPSSCRSGVCHSCLVKATAGVPPEAAQHGLRETWRAQGLFLACMCRQAPNQPAPALLGVGLVSEASVSVRARCVGKELRGEDVVRLELEPLEPLDFRPGQFINLVHDDIVRSYSIASLPSEGLVELHVRRVPHGRMSGWIADQLQVGDHVTIRGPSGDCHYVPGRAAQPLVLAGTGTGLAPLWGIARDALAQGHTGSILLFHGARTPRELYMDRDLRALAQQHSNFHYFGCVSSQDAAISDAQHRRGRVHQVLQGEQPKLEGRRIFVCGSPQVVKTLKQHAYRQGADKDDILADAFIAAPEPSKKKPRLSLPILTEPEPAAGKDARHRRIQRLRFGVQASVLSGFLLQGLLYYRFDFRPLGNLLPFMAYDSLGHLMVSSALVMWAGLFLLAMVFGRFMCGWLCPLGFFQDAGEKLLRWAKISLPAPKSQPRAVRFALACMVVGHFAIMPLLAAPVRVWQADMHFREPWLLGFPFRLELFALDLMLVFVVIGIALPLFFGPRPYCKLVCETGYMLDRASSFAFGRIRRNHGFDQDTCLACGKCTAICPQGINVHEEVNLFDRVVNTSCITCLQCVNTCPNDTIIYSMKKRVADTGKVAGYLAGLHVRAADLPRHVLTGVGVLAGAYLGFRVLPPSYFHTYLLLASLGGLTGYLLWRGARLVRGLGLEERITAEAMSTVEREAKERVLPLTPQERLQAAAQAAAGQEQRRRLSPILVLCAAYLLVMAAASAVIGHLPPRITPVADISRALADPGERAARGVVHFAVPPTLSEHDMHRAFGSLDGYLSRSLARDVIIVGGETYGQLAQALERGAVDALMLPAGAAAAVLGRQARAARGAADPIQIIVQAEVDGRTTFSGALVSKPAGPRRVDELRGKRLAITSFDSVSGFIAPMAILREKGVGSLDLSEIVFAGSAEKALALLASDRVDAAASFDGAIDRFARRNPGVTLEPLETYDGLITDVVLVRAGFHLREALKHVLLSLAADRSSDAQRVRDDLHFGSITAFLAWDPERFAEFQALFRQ